MVKRCLVTIIATWLPSNAEFFSQCFQVQFIWSGEELSLVKKYAFNFFQSVARICSFTINLFLIRVLDPSLMGFLFVRMNLLYNTIGFLSREPLRKTCLAPNLSVKDSLHYALLRFVTVLIYQIADFFRMFQSAVVFGCEWNCLLALVVLSLSRHWSQSLTIRHRASGVHRLSPYWGPSRAHCHPQLEIGRKRLFLPCSSSFASSPKSYCFAFVASTHRCTHGFLYCTGKFVKITLKIKTNLLFF